MAEQVVTLKMMQRGAKDVASGFGKVAIAAAGIASALAVARKAFALIEGALKTSLGLANEFVRAQAKISLVLTEVGADVPKATKQMREFAKWMSLNTEASVGQVQALQAVALSLSRVADPKMINDTVKAGMALQNVIPNRDAGQMTADLVKALQGAKTKTLNMIPAVRSLTKEQLKAGKATEVILELYGSTLSAAVDTVSGRFNNLITVLKDFWGTQLGKSVLESKRLSVGLRVMADEFAALSPNVDDLRVKIGEWAVTAAKGLSTVVTVGGWATDTVLALAETWEKATQAYARFMMVRAEYHSAEETRYHLMAKAAADNIKGIAKTREELSDFAGGLSRAMTKVAAAMEKVGASEKQSTKAAAGIKRISKAADEASKEIEALSKSLEGVYDFDKDDRERANQNSKYARENSEAKMGILLHQDEWRSALEDKQAARVVEWQKNEAKRVSDATQHWKDKYGSTFSYIADTGLNAIGALISGQKTFGEVALDVLRDVAMSTFKSSIGKIINAAAVSAAGAAESTSKIPFVGPIIAAIASAATFAMVMGFQSKTKPPNMAYGGMITGGAVHTDSVLVNAMPGEQMLNTNEAAEWDAYKHGRPTGSQRPVSVTIHQSPLVGNKLENQRWIEDVIMPGVESALARRGLSLGVV